MSADCLVALKAKKQNINGPIQGENFLIKTGDPKKDILVADACFAFAAVNVVYILLFSRKE